MSKDNIDIVYNDDLNLYKSRYFSLYNLLFYLQRYLKALFTLDLRSLAVLRIGMAFLVLLDLSIRFTDLKAHYSNEGVLPLDLLFQHAWGPYTLSIHTMSGLWQVQAFLFFTEALFALFLLAGWRTRLVSVIVWFMHLSLQARNPYVLQGGDDLLRMMLFWGIFLPWGNRYSVDSLNNEKSGDNSYFGLAGAAYLFQICFLYFFTAMLKNSPEWRTEGTAIYYALSLDQMVFPIGKWIYHYPLLLKYLTFSVFYAEILIPFLFFIPLFTGTFRIAAFTLIIMLHLGISLTLFVGLFFLIGIITVSGFLPSQWMDWFDSKTASFQDYIRNFMIKLNNRISKILKVELNVKLKTLNPLYANILKNIFIAFCLLYAFFWNMQNINYFNGITQKANCIGQSIRIDQNWGMFAPTVFKDDGWYILEGTTEKGEMIDLNRDGAPLSYQKPESIVSLFKNDRWRKYSENYLFICNSYMRPYYSDYIYNKWNENHPEKKICKLEVIYMKEVTKPDYKYVAPSREVLAVTSENNDDE